MEKIKNTRLDTIIKSNKIYIKGGRNHQRTLAGSPLLLKRKTGLSLPPILALIYGRHTTSQRDCQKTWQPPYK